MMLKGNFYRGAIQAVHKAALRIFWGDLHHFTTKILKSRPASEIPDAGASWLVQHNY